MALKEERVEQCLRSCGSEFQMWSPKQEKVRKPTMSLVFVHIRDATQRGQKLINIFELSSSVVELTINFNSFSSGYWETISPNEGSVFGN